jgi:hypothetical protein
LKLKGSKEFDVVGALKVVKVVDVDPVIVLGGPRGYLTLGQEEKKQDGGNNLIENGTHDGSMCWHLSYKQGT